MAESVFDSAQLKTYKPPFTCLESISQCLHFNSSTLSWDTVDSSILQSDCLRAFLTWQNYKFSQLLSYFNISQHAKSHADWPCCSWDIAALRIFNYAQLKIYKHLLRFSNLYQHSINHADSLILAWDIVDSRILQWLAKSIFDHTKQKIFKSPFVFLFSVPKITLTETVVLKI